MANGILQKGGKIPCPVDPSGKFTDDVSDFKGQHVKVSVSLASTYMVHTLVIYFLDRMFCKDAPSNGDSITDT